MNNSEKTYHELFDNCSARFDLAVPGVAVECIEELYRTTGAKAVRRDHIVPAAISIGVILGLIFGFDRSGYLYGPIGAALGVVFGAVGGAFAGFILRAVGSPFIRPEYEALRLVRLGKYQNAVRAFRRARTLVWRDRNPIERVAQLILSPMGIGRSDLPPEIALSNLSSCEGVLAESVGDVEETINAYLSALSFWPRSAFALASLMDVVVREEAWERSNDVAKAANAFIERTRDRRLAVSVKERFDAFQAALPVIDANKSAPAQNAAAENRSSAPMRAISCRIVENPGSEISNGSMILCVNEDEKSLKLAAMPFHLILNLADALLDQKDQKMDVSQTGWVSAPQLLGALPWTTPAVTNSNVYKLVYKIRKQFETAGMDRNIIEENMNGCYRLNLAPDNVFIERAALRA